MSPKDQTSEDQTTGEAMEETSKKPKRLGRGLNALFGDDKPAPSQAVAEKAEAGDRRTISVTELHPSPYQPRRIFTDDAIAELAASIKEKGVLQPLLVRPSSKTSGQFEIIAGERRWRACQKAGVHDVPVVIGAFSDEETLEVALIENLQRQDLSAIEEAEGFKRLADEFGLSAESIGARVGKSRAHVANTMRLMLLPKPVQTMVADGRLSAGHARAIINADDPEGLAKKAVAKGLSVRQVEKLAAGAGVKQRTASSKPAVQPKDSDTVRLEKDLSDHLGLKADIAFTGTGGTLTLHYANLDQLDGLIQQLKAPVPRKPASDLDDDTVDLEEIIARHGN